MNLSSSSLKGSQTPKPIGDIPSEAPAGNKTSLLRLTYLWLIPYVLLVRWILFSTYQISPPMTGYILLPTSPSLATMKKKKTPYVRSLPFAFSRRYVLLSAYMMSASFVSFILISSGLGTIMSVASPWSSHSPPTLVPEAPTKTTDNRATPQEFLPKRSRKLAPGKRLLRLGLLAAIAMADSVPKFDLTRNSSETFAAIKANTGS
jgi:hypothetical protein